MTPISGCRAATVFTERQIRPRRQSGFTLLEIILVLAIIATASILVVPSLGGFEARTFSTQVRQAQSLLNYARRTAVVSGQASTISFNVVSPEEADRAGADDKNASLSNIVGTWNGSGVTLRFRDSTDREVEIEQSTEVTFYPEGGSTGGVLLFALAEQSGVIEIDPFTGRVSTGDPEER